ncbi:nucleoside recognition domain-containing protein [Oscillospiraceae bacterium MB08-C2-2]|nr:nucleoside recognition domain-containing protein [Oscillospiraceae bacterium MB08-C2-2]
MMKWIFSGMIFAAVVFGILQGRMDAISQAAIRECGGAVELTLSLMGSMCMWSGFMKIAEKAGLTKKLSRLFSPVIRLLFEKMNPDSAAAQAITLNISANLLGLGNAATPLGIAAMRQMEKDGGYSKTASNNMAMFVVLNTACLQLIPTTTALLRANAGAAEPLDIMPAAWAASLLSVLSGIIMAKILSKYT